VYRGAEYKVEYLPKLRLEIVAEDDDVQPIVTAIADNAKTGKIGDGKFWVMPVDIVGRIRTGDLGSDAL
jgi:nitrogen regulatory protein P-II 1